VIVGFTLFDFQLHSTEGIRTARLLA